MKMFYEKQDILKYSVYLKQHASIFHLEKNPYFDMFSENITLYHHLWERCRAIYKNTTIITKM